MRNSKTKGRIKMANSRPNLKAHPMIFPWFQGAQGGEGGEGVALE
jgi:hypothetical protein